MFTYTRREDLDVIEIRPRVRSRSESHRIDASDELNLRESLPPLSPRSSCSERNRQAAVYTIDGDLVAPKSFFNRRIFIFYRRIIEEASLSIEESSSFNCKKNAPAEDALSPPPVRTRSQCGAGQRCTS